MKGKTVVDAAAEWVNGFNAVRYGMIETLMKAFPNDWSELTTPSYGDRVCVWDGENDGQRGVIVEDRYDKEPDLHRIEFDNKELGDVILAEDEFEVERDSLLPMWGWLWSFGNSADDYWLEELDGIRLMSECGFRIYEHEEWATFSASTVWGIRLWTSIGSRYTERAACNGTMRKPNTSARCSKWATRKASSVISESGWTKKIML